MMLEKGQFIIGTERETNFEERATTDETILASCIKGTRQFRLIKYRLELPAYV